MSTSPLPAVRDQLLSIHNDNLKRGELLPPERTRGNGREALLNAMHAHGNHDSLVYWLEFKNDDDRLRDLYQLFRDKLVRKQVPRDQFWQHRWR